ncbi:MAG: hypothetical protein KJ793_02720, partial [Candidatus Omnitrophica bacterium]|nr:hypothetical protein [Candidatus Omnitrophota bacterium]
VLIILNLGSGLWLGYFLAAPLGFSHRGKSASFAYAQDAALSENEGLRLEFLLALTEYLIAGEPWPLAQTTCCSKTPNPSR